MHGRYFFRGFLLAVWKCSKTNYKAAPPQKQEEVVKRFSAAMFSHFYLGKRLYEDKPMPAESLVTFQHSQ